MPRTKPYVVEYLTEHGPATARSVAEDLGLEHNFARAKIATAKRRLHIHIHDWIRSSEGCTIERLCARYAVGNLPDAKKPKPLSRTVANRHHRARKARKVTSIFDAGVPIDERRMTTRKRPDVVKRRDVKTPCGECHLQPGERCDVCGASFGT